MDNLWTSFFRKRKNVPGRAAQLASKKTRFPGAEWSLNREWHLYESRSGLYRYLRDRVPVISSAVWNWVRLCNTPGSVHFTGNDSYKDEARKVIDSLFTRIANVKGVKRKGLGNLLERFFIEVFTNGSFCGKIVPLPSGTGIDYFDDFDIDQIKWKRNGRWIPYLKQGDNQVKLDSDLFFHYGLGADIKHPEGVSFLSSVEFVTIIEQRMISDMALSSHNAGNPHLHIKISPLEKYENESDGNYVKRAEKYFDETVGMFNQIDPDDNIFSWSDLDITVIGGERALPTTWKVNREQVIEDVITGMKLFPWVVGRSHGTTKNWVQAQFNLLMQVVDSIQEEGKALAEWVINMELKMTGLPVRAEYIFSPNQDPYLLEREKASAIKFETVDKKVMRGYISKKDGAAELGYNSFFCEDD